MLELNKIYQGDCLEVSKDIESGSVDLILTDLPYGTMNGFNGIDWDFAIDPKDVYAIANRILRKNGKMVLFSQEPYTTRLITGTNANVPFSYRAVWEKDSFANALLCNKAMVGYYEDILVFSKNHDTNVSHPLREYALKVKAYTNYTRSYFFKTLGHGGAQHFVERCTTANPQFSLCTEQTYNELICIFKINEMEGFREYSELKHVDEQFKRDLPSTFNLWQGGKYKSNILSYKKDYNGYHPTQKPVLLLEDLIKTFSNEGDTVVDLTCGSGSTCVAARNTSRFFVGIEKEIRYVDISNKRVTE